MKNFFLPISLKCISWHNGGIQLVDRGPYLGYPDELRLRPKFMLRKEKVEISKPDWHSGQNPATCPEITEIGITCVPVGIDEIFLKILNALGMD